MTSDKPKGKRPVGRPPAPYRRINATFEQVIKALVETHVDGQMTTCKREVTKAELDAAVNEILQDIHELRILRMSGPS